MNIVLENSIEINIQISNLHKNHTNIKSQLDRLKASIFVVCYHIYDHV